MARTKNAWCGVCQETITGLSVLENETEMTKHWKVHCPGCHHRFDYTEVKMPWRGKRRRVRP